MAAPTSRRTLPPDPLDTRIHVSKPKATTVKHSSISKLSRPAPSPIDALRKAEALERTLAASPESLINNTVLEHDRMNDTNEEPTLSPLAQTDHEMMLLEETNNISIKNKNSTQKYAEIHLKKLKFSYETYSKDA